MRITRYAASLAAAGLLLTACGGSDAGNEAADAAENTAEVAEEVDFPAQ